MGLLEVILGKDNPATQWTGQNRNFLDALASGLAQGPDFGTGVARGLQMVPQAKMLDMQAAQAREEKAKQEQQTNATRTLLEKEAPDLAQLLDTGIPMGEVWGEYLRRKQPQTGEAKNPFMSAGDGTFFNWQTGQWVTNPNAKPDVPNAPSGYQYTPSGALAPIPGGPADPVNPLNARRSGGGTPSPTIAKEIFEADEGAQAGHNVLTALDQALTLNEGAWDGPLADVSSSGAALFGNQDAVQTQELKNIVTANALESLKATFGAAPTEGERKILLEVQGSINQPRAVRKAIFERAKAAAERRLQFNEERARSLRGGEYFDEGYSPVGGGNKTATGVTWSIEP